MARDFIPNYEYGNVIDNPVGREVNRFFNSFSLRDYTSDLVKNWYMYIKHKALNIHSYKKAYMEYDEENLLAFCKCGKSKIITKEKWK